MTVDCPPDYIIVELMDSSTGEIRDKSTLHADFNLNDEKESKPILFPISLSMEEAIEVRTKDKKKIEARFKQHACELAFCLTVWKAQGRTFDKVILHLEPSGWKGWSFENLYVAFSRVRMNASIRCLPLSPSFKICSFRNLLPNIWSTRWRIVTREHGTWR